MDINYPIQNQEVKYFHRKEFTNKNSEKYLTTSKGPSVAVLIQLSQP